MNWCRTCLSCDNKLVSIYKSYNIKGIEHSIIDILSTVTSIRISSDDKYSKEICKPCILKAVAAFEFKITVEKCQANFENKANFCRPEFFNDDLYLIIVKNFKKNKDLLTKSQSDSSVNEEKPFDCKLCNETFRTFSELKHHRSKHIKKPMNNLKYSGLDVTKSGDEECSMQPEDVQNFMCDVCGIVKKTMILLNVHKLTHDQMEDKRMCTFCGKAFHSERYFYTHMQNHKDSDESELNSFTCDDCGLPFDNKESLKRHIFVKHVNVKSIQCKMCSKYFKTKGNLKDHMNFHCKDQTAQCYLCGKKCADKKSLITHVRIHTGEKLYDCTICNVQFLSAGRAKIHMITKHEEKKEICPVCDRKYYLKTTLNVHMKSHIEINKNNLLVKMAV